MKIRTASSLVSISTLLCGFGCTSVPPNNPSFEGGASPTTSVPAVVETAPSDDVPEPEVASAPHDDASPAVQVAPPDRPIARPATSPFGFELLGESGGWLPTYSHGDRRYVLGTRGSRYTIRLRNPTPSRVEAVVSVDGLDVIDGQRGDLSKRGYILAPYSTMTVEGFRTSTSDVAAFRFSSVRDSYAARTGSARNVGVIGVAFFPERPAPPPPPMWTPRGDEPRDFDGSLSRAPARAMPKSAPSVSSEATDDRFEPGIKGSSRGASPSAAAPSKDSSAEEKAGGRNRPGLGTEFGERRESAVSYTSFERANPRTPSRTMSLYYNDRDGLIALGIQIPRPVTPREDDARMRETAEPFAHRFAAPPPPRSR